MRAEFRPSSIGYVAELDGLRAIAVLLVIVFHCWPSLLPGGSIGVDIFFVLSGYLITAILLAEHARTGTISISQFLMRRFIRLVPAFLALLVVVALLSLLRSSAEHQLKIVAIAGLYLMNWSRALGWGFDGLMGHTWSLAIEQQFYLLWAPIVLVALRISGLTALRMTTLALIVAITVHRYALFDGHNIVRVYNGFDTRADMILYGALAAMIPTASFDAILARLILLPVAVLAVIAIAVSHENPALYGPIMPLAALASAWIIISVQNGATKYTRLVLSNNVLVYLGTISYAMYLWHYPLLYFFNRLKYPPLILLSCLIVTIGIAALSKRFIEDPAQERGRRAMRARARPTAADPVASLPLENLDERRR